MIATFKPCRLQGTLNAPPSKSMAHRYLIGAALSGQKCTLSGVDYSEDILASMDCLRALGAKITVDADKFVSRGHNTPFHGRTYYGAVCATIVGGRVIDQE